MLYRVHLATSEALGKTTSLGWTIMMFTLSAGNNCFIIPKLFTIMLDAINTYLCVFMRPSLRRDVLWYTNVRLSVYPSVCLFISLSVCPSVHFTCRALRTPWPIHFKFHREKKSPTIWWIKSHNSGMKIRNYTIKYTDRKTTNSNNSMKFEVNWPRGS
jgi:hypothetical protein